MTKGRLFLFPHQIGETPFEQSLVASQSVYMGKITHYICEHAKSLRALLKFCGIPSPYDHLWIRELNKHTTDEEKFGFLEPALKGNDIGLCSDAGCPGMADPGAEIVALAHEQGIEVFPLVGPSSFLLCLMGSGFNGQRFSFRGYLSPKRNDLVRDLRGIEAESRKNKESVFWIETPYRNQSLWSTALEILHPTTRLCLGYGLQHSEQILQTKTVSDWRSTNLKLDKVPAIFGLEA